MLSPTARPAGGLPPQLGNFLTLLAAIGLSVNFTQSG
jgi:hypothetical protein